MALTEQGFIYGWGTFRNSSGVYAFSAQDRLALLPVLVYSPDAPARQAVKIVSGLILIPNADHSAMHELTP